MDVSNTRAGVHASDAKAGLILPNSLIVCGRLVAVNILRKKQPIFSITLMSQPHMHKWVCRPSQGLSLIICTCLTTLFPVLPLMICETFGIADFVICLYVFRYTVPPMLFLL